MTQTQIHTATAVQAPAFTIHIHPEDFAHRYTPLSCPLSHALNRALGTEPYELYEDRLYIDGSCYRVEPRFTYRFYQQYRVRYLAGMLYDAVPIRLVPED